MTQVAQPVESLKPQPRIAPERLAWATVLLAFALFCVICVATTLGLHFFFFESTIPLEAILKVGRGTASIATKSEPIAEAIRQEPRLLSNLTEISTDAQTQATIVLRDSAGEAVSIITVRRDTELVFSRAEQPRFEWSSTEAYIIIENLAGSIDVFVPKTLKRQLRLVIRTVQGGWVSLNNGGHYRITASNEQVSVANEEGEAVLFAEGFNRSIPPDMRGTLVADATEIALSPDYIELLENSRFEILPPESISTNSGVGILPVGWVCTNTQDDLPSGSFGVEIKDGLQAMRLVRGQGASSHGESRCHQAFPGQNGLDISGYGYLALRVTFLVDFQSLSACGTEGSECPLMLKMDYVDTNGNEQEWFHGFYARVDPLQANYPLRCASCRLEHQRILEKTWYTYESENLFTLLPADPQNPGQRPASILNIRFYASGHQYDVYVSELSLLAGPAAGVPAVSG